MHDLLAYLFAIHLGLAAQVPPELGASVYHAARDEGVDPYALATMLITEESGPDRDFSLFTALQRWGNGVRYDYETNTTGQAGEQGHFQMIPYWGRKWARAHGLDPDTIDLYDERTNVRIAAYVVAQAQASHAAHADEQPNHGWVAHWKCQRTARDALCGQCGYAKRKWRYVYRSLFNFELTREQVTPILGPYNTHCTDI